MKTARSAPPIALPHATSLNRAAKPSTPLTSPRILVHSVGQACSPKLSPSAASRQSPRPSPTTAQSQTQPQPQAQNQEGMLSSASYFGLVFEQADHRDSSGAPLNNWSPSSSAVKSFAAAIPNSFLPLDANPAFDAFRLQAEANSAGRAFALNGAQFRKAGMTTPMMTDNSSMGSVSSFVRPRLPKTPGHRSSIPWETGGQPAKLANITSASAAPTPPLQSVVDIASLQDSAYVSSDASLEPAFFPNLPCFESPAQLEQIPELRANLSPVEECHPGLSLSLGVRPVVHPAYFGIRETARADTVPAKLEAGLRMMDVAELKTIMEAGSAGSPPSLLLLDVRVSTYYAQSRIRGALNLCIPTTLLKRATFDLQKMQKTFAGGEDREKFSAWQDAKYLVVYDAASSGKRDATAALNMLRKFTAEGFKGQACVLGGGFQAFASTYPELVETSAVRSTSMSLGNSDGTRGLGIAPLHGGVMLPDAGASPMPFFGNIRQNVDLADGVGQMDVCVPESMDTKVLPQWLREVADPNDRGGRASQRFLDIEMAEKSRMQEAYTLPSSRIKLSGIEQGIKNRYKDILPFEHARVRLHGRPEGACDYVNASHIRASRSAKRYIASQAPLPTTLEDFWSVVWDEDVRVIVMLTAEAEEGQVKCHSYWNEQEYGATKLRLLSEKKVLLCTENHRVGSKVPNASASAASAASAAASTSADDSNDANAAAGSGRRRACTVNVFGGNGGAHLPNASLPRDAQPPTGAGTTNDTPFVIVRKFALTHTGRPFQPLREITQLQYSSWPDFGAPAKPSHLLALVELANAMHRAACYPAAASSEALNKSSTLDSMGEADMADKTFWPSDKPESSANTKPMLVHCSAGCGRTGTFCTVDSVIDMLKRQRLYAGEKRNGGESDAVSNTDSVDVAMADMDAKHEAGGSSIDHQTNSTDQPAWVTDDSADLVAATVEDFRTQRLSMVQSLRQFVLCYETVAEWVSKANERPSGRPQGRGRSESVNMRM